MKLYEVPYFTTLRKQHTCFFKPSYTSICPKVPSPIFSPSNSYARCPVQHIPKIKNTSPESVRCPKNNIIKPCVSHPVHQHLPKCRIQQSRSQVPGPSKQQKRPDNTASSGGSMGDYCGDSPMLSVGRVDSEVAPGGFIC